MLAVEAEFGTLGRVLLDDQALAGLGGRTAAAALADGARPRDVWLALCVANDIPEHRRSGRRLREPDIE